MSTLDYLDPQEFFEGCLSVVLPEWQRPKYPDKVSFRDKAVHQVKLSSTDDLGWQVIYWPLIPKKILSDPGCGFLRRENPTVDAYLRENPIEVSLALKHFYENESELLPLGSHYDLGSKKFEQLFWFVPSEDYDKVTVVRAHSSYDRVLQKALQVDMSKLPYTFRAFGCLIASAKLLAATKTTDPASFGFFPMKNQLLFNYGKALSVVTNPVNGMQGYFPRSADFYAGSWKSRLKKGEPFLFKGSTTRFKVDTDALSNDAAMQALESVRDIQGVDEYVPDPCFLIKYETLEKYLNKLLNASLSSLKDNEDASLLSRRKKASRGRTAVPKGYQFWFRPVDLTPKLNDTSLTSTGIFRYGNQYCFSLPKEVVQDFPEVENIHLYRRDKINKTASTMTINHTTVPVERIRAAPDEKVLHSDKSEGCIYFRWDCMKVEVIPAVRSYIGSTGRPEAQDSLLILEALENLMQWIEDPYKVDLGNYEFDFLDLADPQSECPYSVLGWEPEERAEYIFERAKLQAAPKSERTRGRKCSPRVTLYDKYCIWYAFNREFPYLVTEQGTPLRLSKEQQREYIVRAFLPWRRPQNLQPLIKDRVDRKIPGQYISATKAYSEDTVLHLLDRRNELFGNKGLS